MEALNDVVRMGKARYIGASTMYAWQFAKILNVCERYGWTKPINMQLQLNCAYREEEREMIPLCLDQKVGLIPWSPLARGYLARTRETIRDTVRAGSDEFAGHLYRRDSDLDIVDRNAEVASRLGVKPAQTALAWMLSKPGVVSPIIGASKPHHLQDAIEAMELTLSAEDVEHLEAPYEPHPVLGHN